MDENSQLRVAKNTALLVFLRVVAPLLDIVLVLAVSRFLGTEGLGRYTLAYTFLFVGSAIGPLGLNTVVTRDGARDRTVLNHTLANAISIATVASLLLMLGTMAVASFSNYDIDTRTSIIVLSLAIIPSSIGILLDGACMAMQRADKIAVATAFEYVVKVGGGTALLFMGYGLNEVLFLAVIARTIACVIQAVLLKKSGVTVGWGRDRASIGMLLRLAPTFLGISIFATLYWRIDVFMLSQMRPVEDVGYYGAAYRILELAMVIPQSLCSSLYPQIAAAVQTDVKALKSLGATALRYLMAISLPAAICAALLAEPGLELLYGKGFDAAATTLRVLIFTLIPYSIVRYHAYVLVGANRQQIDLGLNVVMSIVNIGLNFLLIPRYSHLGAAAATLVAISVYAVLQYWYLARCLPGHAAALSLQPPVLVATAITAGCVWLLYDKPLVLTICVGAVLYFCSLLLGGFFTRSELQIMGVSRLLGKGGFPRG